MSYIDKVQVGDTYYDIRSEVDKTLTENNVPADAKSIGDEIADIREELDILVSNGKSIPIEPILALGGINGSGTEFGETSGTYMRFAEYIPTSEATRFEIKKTTDSDNAVYVCYYNSSKVFQSRISGTNGMVIDDSYAFFRLSFYRRNGNNEAEYRTWFTWTIENVVRTKLDTLESFVALHDQVDYVLENGGINSSGSEISGSTYMRFADYIPTSEASNMTFKTVTGSTGSCIFAVYYDKNKTFKTRVTTTVRYSIDTDYAFVRLSFYEPNGANESLFRSWIYWPNGNPIAEKFKNVESKVANNTFSKSGNVITIKTNKAQYSLQRVTSQSINVDTWRLFSGNLITTDGSLFNMWTNSDAEGVMKLVGEDDFIGGFHGDEIMTDVHIIVDGAEIDLIQDFDDTDFNTMIVYVESDVYHSNTSADAGVKAFKRNKQLIFEGNKVTVSNDFEAVNNVSVKQASLAFFQCYSDDASNNEILNSYSVNSDFKLYDIADTSVYPKNSKYLTEAIYNTAYGNIVVKNTKIDPRYESYYFSDVSIGTLIAQDRLKIYFNTIPNTPSGVSMASGDDIFGSFEWEIV